MKYLAFDLGLSHTGVAVSHEGQLAETMTTLNIKNVSQLFKQLLQMVKVEKPDVVIIGQPNRGPVHQMALDLETQLLADNPPEIILLNEDRSSSDAERHFVSTGATLAHRKKTQHQAAAAILLQKYLDNM